MHAWISCCLEPSSMRLRFVQLAYASRNRFMFAVETFTFKSLDVFTRI
jgi:hypothetical protein